MPPFGNLYDVPVHVDRSVAQAPDMIFGAGTRRETMKVAYADFVRLVQPVMEGFSWHL